jgi:hypothetical protein
MATGHFSLLFLIAGLFLPRLTLFVAWLMSGYPVNPLPVLINFLGWLFLPRFLIAYFIYVDSGPNNLWFWAYIVAGLLGFVGEGGYARRRVVRRTTVSRDGRTTTTVEEEEV